jgi:hypothetical protein
VTGELGGNLLSKYSMLGRFYATQEAIDFLEMGIVDCLASRNEKDDPEARATVMQYLRSVVLHVPFAEVMEECPAWTTAFDLAAWEREGYSRPLEGYRLEEPITLRTTVPPDRKAQILTRIQTFGEHPSGLGKFTRTMFARDLRRTLAPAEALQGVPV